MTARYKSACCCDVTGNTGFGPCFMGFGSVPKSTYSPDREGAKWRIQTPINVGPAGVPPEDPPDDYPWGSNTLRNPFDNWEYCGDSYDDELVMYCERELVKFEAEAAVPPLPNTGCPEPPSTRCCNCGPYSIGNETTGNVKPGSALTSTSQNQGQQFTPIITRYRSPWSTQKMPSLPYGYYSGGNGLPSRVDDTLYHYSFETMTSRTIFRSGNLFPMDGQDGSSVGNLPTDKFQGGNIGFSPDFFTGYGGDGYPCYQQDYALGGYGVDTLCAQLNIFPFCADGYRTPRYGLPATQGQAAIIGATFDIGDVPAWSTSKWGLCKTSRHGPDETGRPYERGGNFFWLKELSNHRPDEWFLDLNLRAENAQSLGLLPGQGPDGSQRLTNTVLGVIHRERWWKKYYTSLLEQDNRPGAVAGGVGDTPDAQEYFNNGFFSGELDWFGWIYRDEGTNQQPGKAVLNGRSPEYVYKACSGCPIFSWEIGLNTRLMCTDADSDRHIRCGDLFTGPLGTLPILDNSDRILLATAYTETQALITGCSGLLGPAGGWPLDAAEVGNMPLGYYLFHIFNGFPVMGQCIGGGAVYWEVGFITPGIMNVLLALGIMSDPVPTGEDQDYRIFKKEMLAYIGGIDDKPRGICCFSGLETSADCTDEHETGGCAIPACGDIISGIVPHYYPGCAFDQNDYYVCRIQPSFDFWNDTDNGGYWGTSRYSDQNNARGISIRPDDMEVFSQNVFAQLIEEYGEDEGTLRARQTMEFFLGQFEKIEDNPDDDYNPEEDPRLQGFHYFQGDGWNDICVDYALGVYNNASVILPECELNFVGCADDVTERSCRDFGGQWTDYDVIPGGNSVRCFLEDGTPDGVIDYCIPCAQRNPDNPGAIIPGPPANYNVKGACVRNGCNAQLFPFVSQENRCDCGSAFSEDADRHYDDIRIPFPEPELEEWRDNAPGQDDCDCFEMSAGTAWTPAQGCDDVFDSQGNVDSDLLPQDGFAYNPEVECYTGQFDPNIGTNPNQGPCPNSYTWYPNRNCINTNGSSPRIPGEGPEDDICLDRGPNYNETSDLPPGLEDAIVRKSRWFYGRPGGWGFASEAGAVEIDGVIVITGSQHKQIFPQILSRETEISTGLPVYTAPGPQYQKCTDSELGCGECSDNPCPNGGSCPQLCDNEDAIRQLEAIGCGLPIIAVCGSVDPQGAYSPCDSIGLSHTCDGIWAQHSYYSLIPLCPDDATGDSTDPGGYDVDRFSCSHINNTSWIITDNWLEFDESKGPDAPVEDQVTIFSDVNTVIYQCDVKTFDETPADETGGEYRVISFNDDTGPLNLVGGWTFVFDMSDGSFGEDDFLRFSLLENGVYNEDSDPADHVPWVPPEPENLVYEGTPGRDGAKVTLTVPSGLPSPLYYYVGPPSRSSIPDDYIRGDEVTYTPLSLTGWVPRFKFDDDEITPQYRDRDWFAPPYALMDIAPSSGANPCCWDAPKSRGYVIDPRTGAGGQVLCPSGPRVSKWERPDGEIIEFRNAPACLNPKASGRGPFCTPELCGFNLRPSFGELDPVCGPYPSGPSAEGNIFLCCHHTQQWFGYDEERFPPVQDPEGYTGTIIFPCNKCRDEGGSPIEDCPDGKICTTLLGDCDAAGAVYCYYQECLEPDDPRRENPINIQGDF